MRTGSEMEEETRHGEVEVDDIELGNYRQSTTALNEIEPGYDETQDADLIRSQRDQVGVETETEDNGTENEDSGRETADSGRETEDSGTESEDSGRETADRGRETEASGRETEGSVQASEDAQTGSRRFQEEQAMHFELHRAAWQGNWDIVKEICETKKRKEIINHSITERGQTALHVAVSEGQTDFVRNLIKLMSKEAIKAPDKFGNTAFCNAATAGNVELAHEMLKRVEDLANIRGIKGMLPIYVAALLGHKKMVSYLYDRTSDKAWKDDELINLLVTLIDNDIYDVALRMVEKHKALAVDRDGKQKTALDALARKKIGQAGTKCFNVLCCGAHRKSNPLPIEASRLLHLLWENVQLSDHRIDFEVNRSTLLTFKAARKGNSELLTLLIRTYPELVTKVDGNNCSIFHIAVLHRHEDVFKLIHEIGSAKSLVAAIKDNKKNNLLHLAAKLSPKKRLDAIPGAILQLQHDLLWFEEVEKVVNKSYVEANNLDKQTPEEVFLIEHKDIINEGWKWMRDTANSCMLVAILIATVVFAAAFTLPGGNNQAGKPTFLHDPQFQVFAIADAISLTFSVSAVLNYLSILSSRYTLNDLKRNLPGKLIQGLGMLFISVVAMMVAYIAAIFIIFKSGLLRTAIPIAATSIFPGVLFVWQQSGLLRDVVRSTYMHKYLFQPNKHTLVPRPPTEKPRCAEAANAIPQQGRSDRTTFLCFLAKGIRRRRFEQNDYV